VDFANTVSWGGAGFVVVNGTDIGDINVTSQSGFDYNGTPDTGAPERRLFC
jgi:hypothetical protein